MRDNITKQELCDKIAKSAGCTKKLACEILDELPDIIEKGLYEEGQVRVSGLGTFKLKWMEEREGRNPQTGESLIIPAHSKVIFRPEKGLSEHINRKYSHLKPRELTSAQAEKWDEKKSKKGWYWLAAAAAAIILLLVICPGKESDESLKTPTSVAAESNTNTTESRQEPQSVAVSEPQPETESAAAKAEPAAKTEQAAAKPETDRVAERQTGLHKVQKGDNLWNLAGTYYNDYYLWPNIYRVNTDKIENPDLLQIGWQLSIPELQGTADNLTEQDSMNIAKGYEMAFQAYK